MFTIILFGNTREGEGALAKWELMVTPNTELADLSRVERALKDTLAKSQDGGLQLDPQYLELRQGQLFNEDDSEGSDSNPFGSKKLWIVIGCVSALIVLALIQAGLTIYKVTGKTSSHKVSCGFWHFIMWCIFEI